jgi:hypothetical protein
MNCGIHSSTYTCTLQSYLLKLLTLQLICEQLHMFLLYASDARSAAAAVESIMALDGRHDGICQKSRQDAELENFVFAGTQTIHSQHPFPMTLSSSV